VATTESRPDRGLSRVVIAVVVAAILVGASLAALELSGRLSSSGTQSHTPPTVEQRLTSVVISPATAVLHPSGSQAFSARPLDQNGNQIESGVPFNWTLNPTSIGTLSASSGASVSVTASSTLQSGTLSVTAVFNGTSETGSAQIKVNATAPPPTPTITSFTVSPATVTVGGTTDFAVDANDPVGTLSYVYSGLPTGCATVDVALLPCVPLISGTFDVTVTVADSDGTSASASTSLMVSPIVPPPSSFTVKGALLYQPGGANYSSSSAAGTGVIVATNGSEYRVPLSLLNLSSLTPEAITGNFNLTPICGTSGYFSVNSWARTAVQSTAALNQEVNLSINSVGMSAANLTFGVSTLSGSPMAYLAFGEYPTFFSNVTLQGADLNLSLVEGVFPSIDFSWLSGLVEKADPSAPTSFSSIVVVNRTIWLPNSEVVSGQVQSIISPKAVASFISSVAGSNGSFPVISAALDILDEELVVLATPSPGSVGYSFLIAPGQLNRSSLAGIVSLEIEQSTLVTGLVRGINTTNPNATFPGSPVHATFGVTWDQRPVAASGYTASNVTHLWQVGRDEAVSLQAAAVGVTLNETGNLLSGLGYAESQYVMDAASLDNPAVFLLVDPAVVQSPNLSAAFSYFAVALVPNDALSSQFSVDQYLTLDGVAYNTSYYLDSGTGCALSDVTPGCPLFVADSVSSGTPVRLLPSQLSRIQSPTFVNTTGYAVGTTLKHVASELPAASILAAFKEIVQSSPIDVGVYDLGYSSGLAGYNLPSIYFTWGQGPTLNVTHNLTEGLYLPEAAASATANQYLANYSSYYSELGQKWGQNLSMLQGLASQVNDTVQAVAGAVTNGSVLVPGVLLMMDLWANKTAGTALIDSMNLTDHAEACPIITSECVQATAALSANSGAFVQSPSTAGVLVNLSGPTSSGDDIGTNCVAWIANVGPCLPGLVGCLTFGLCFLTPYHVVYVTSYLCYANSSLSVLCPGTPAGSGNYSVSYDLLWNYTILGGDTIAVSSALPVHLSQGPTITLLPTLYPNPLAPGVLDVNETATFSAIVTGGSGGYTYLWAGLPPGCTSSNASTLACTPNTSGNYSVNLTVTDSSGVGSLSPNILFSVNPLLTVSSFTATPATLDAGQTTAILTTVSGGTSPYLYSYPAWPALCLPTNTSSFGCLALFAGSYVVNVTVVDVSLATVTASTTIMVNPILLQVASLSSSCVSLSGTLPPLFPCPTSTYVNVTVSGGTSPYTYSFSGLPSGCSSSNSSNLLCAPNNSSLTYCTPILGYPCWGWYNITVTVSDAVGATASTVIPLFLTVTSDPMLTRRTRR
jgi:hypothetical protein